MILERDDELATLDRHLPQSADQGGTVALIRGEAGIGKTALVRELAGRLQERAHVLAGVCDDYSTPQPLGPFWDIARRETTLAEALRNDDRRAVFEILLDLLSRALRPTVLILEDTHWADEATLDVITFLGRRIARANALLVLTYRDGEVDTDHPLRQVIGELDPRRLVRIRLSPLSPQAIGTMAEGASVDVGRVMELTGGNPLFAREVIESADYDVPASVQDSVLARTARVSPDARRVLDLVSVAPGHLERGLLEAVLGPDPDSVAQCVARGFLTTTEDALSFRHELQRQAIEAALSPSDRRTLNLRILEELRTSGDPARLMHHAREARDVDAIVEFAPRAARAAAAIESHREAIAHFRALEPHLDRIKPAERADLCVQWAGEEFIVDNAEALDILDRAVELYREIGDRRSLGRTLAVGVRMNELHARPDTADAYSIEAVDILEALPESDDLAFALTQQAWLRLMRGDNEASGIALADRAIAIAERFGDDLTRCRALVTKGGILHSSNDLPGIRLVEEGLRLAERRGYRVEEVYALVNLGGLAGDVRDIDRGLDMTQRARNTAGRYELRSEETYATAMLSEMLLWKGDWEGAENMAIEVLGSHPHAEMLAWRILGTIQARRGRAEAGETLARMWRMAKESGELQNIDPAAATLAEHFWLTGSLDAGMEAELRDVIARGMQSGYVWPSGALAFWAWKLGILDPVPENLSPFYRWIIEGSWQDAAAFWEARGIPYEQALALMHGDHDARLRALRIFEDLGADGSGGRLRRLLLDEGTTVPRGRSKAAREHGAGLTARQAEVLELLAEDLTNADIADRLFVSPRTVENHVAAILMKLDVPNRRRAVDAAKARGLLGEHPSPLS